MPDPVIPDAAAAAAAAAAAQTPWHQGVDDDTLGYIRQRGLETVSAQEAFLNVAKAHREAERLIGAPATELQRWPKDASDAAGWQAVRTRLGVPTDANEYDFATLKQGDKDVDPTVASWLRASASQLHLTKEQAVEFGKAYLDYNAKQSADAAASTAAKQQAELTALRTSWGANYDTNRQAALSVAEKMLEASGLAKEDVAGAINALEGQVGGAKVMEMFRAFSKMGREDDFTAPTNRGGGDIMSFQEAQATKQSLMRDSAWVAKWNNGDMEAIKQMAALDTILTNNRPQSDEDAFRAQVSAQYRQ